MQREYASVLTRFGALVIDGLLQWLFFVPIWIAIALKDEPTAFYEGRQLLTILALTLGSFCFFLWNNVYRMGTTGQSLGRQFLGIIVLDGQGRPIGVGRAFLREIIGRWISGLVCYIGYLNAFWDNRKQMWHDKMANCYVFYGDPGDATKDEVLPPSQR